ncbi:hypothetical protein DsansV1_C08g0083261 [Dioscorea sansibarensis]
MDYMVDTTPTLGLHILDLCRKGIIGRPTLVNNSVIQMTLPATTENIIGCQPVLSAVRLYEHGVRFRTSPAYNVTDISFDKDKGILSLPLLLIDDATESTFLSLMLFQIYNYLRQLALQKRLQESIEKLQRHFPAEQVRQELPEQLRKEIDEQVINGQIPEERLKLLLEQLQRQAQRQQQGFCHHVASYIFFMKELIESDRDVRLLKSKNIIRGYVENGQAAAHLLNRLAKGIVHIPTYEIEKVRREVNEYCEKKVNRLLKARVNRWLPYPHGCIF